MPGYGLGNYTAPPPPGNGVNIEDLFNIVSPKPGDPGINSRVDSVYPNVAIITFDATNQFGGMWAKQRLDLTLPFSTEIYLYLGREYGKPNGSADGMTFTLHNDPAGLNAIGGAGEGLGVYKGRKWNGTYYQGNPVTVDHGTFLRNSLVVEIDTYENDGPNVYDLKNGGAHCAILVPRRDIIYFSEHINRFSISPTQQWTKFMVTWTPNTIGGGTLQYTLGSVERTYAVANIQNTFGGTKVYWGFTGSTGHQTALQAAAITKLPLQGLLVTKTVTNQAGSIVDNGFVLPGETVRYVIRATVESLSEPIGPIVFEDILADKLAYVSANQVDVTSDFALPFKADPAISGQTLSVDTGITLIEDFDWVEIAFDVTVDAAAVTGTAITNQATISAATGLPAPATTNITSMTVLTQAQAIKKVSDSSRAGRNNSAVKAADRISYEITYANYTAGPVDITITDALPTGVDFVSADNGGVYQGHTVTWDLPGVPAGMIGSVIVEVQVNASAVVQIENEATVLYDTVPVVTDPVINLLAAEQPVKRVSTTSPAGQDGSEVHAGDQIIYEIDYRNEGGADADISIVDQLPLGVSFVSASDDGVFDEAAHTVTWTLNDIASGAGGTVSLTVVVNERAVRKISNYAIIQVGTVPAQFTNPVMNPIRGIVCSNIKQVTKCRQIITGQVLWSDNNNLGNTRPPSIEVILLRDGAIYKGISMDSFNDTQFAFNCVPISKNYVHKYSYQIDELGLPSSYQKVIDGTTIINTLISSFSQTAP